MFPVWSPRGKVVLHFGSQPVSFEKGEPIYVYAGLREILLGLSDSKGQLVEDWPVPDEPAHDIAPSGAGVSSVVAPNKGGRPKKGA